MGKVRGVKGVPCHRRKTTLHPLPPVPSLAQCQAGAFAVTAEPDSSKHADRQRDEGGGWGKG